MEKISYDVVNNIVGSDDNVSKLVWEGVEIKVKRFLTMKEMFEFTNSVVDACFRKDDGSYRPEVKDFMVRSCILDIYTNIEIPENLENRYDMVYRFGVISEIMRYIDQAQFNAIMSAIDCKIDDRLNTYIEMLEKNLEEKVAVLDQTVENLVEYIGGIFNGIDNETIQQIAGAISNMSIDPAVLARSVVEARETTKTDTENIKK